MHTVLVIDDHALMRDGLKALISAEPDLEVVAAASSAHEALAQSASAEIALLDLNTPHSGGVEAIPVLKRKMPGIRILALTLYRDDSHIRAALAAGAEGYVLKEDSKQELLLGIRSLLAGNYYLTPSVCEPVVSGYLKGGSQTAAPPPADPLTQRERQVIKLVAEGRTTREIAQYLSLSPKTVEKHRANMMRKLDLHNASAVTAYAISRGII